MSCRLLFLYFCFPLWVGWWQSFLAIFNGYVCFLFMFWVSVGWFPGMKEEVSFVLVFPPFWCNECQALLRRNINAFVYDRSGKETTNVDNDTITSSVHKISIQSLNVISYLIATLAVPCQKMPWKTCLSEEEQARGKTWTDEDWSRIRPGWNCWHG